MVEDRESGRPKGWHARIVATAALLCGIAVAPYTLATPLSLDPIDSGEISLQVRTPVLPFPPPVPVPPEIQYRTFKPLDAFNFESYSSTGCLCSVYWEVTGYAVFDLWAVTFPIESATLQFDLDPDIDIDIGHLDIYTVDTHNPADLAALISGFTVPIPQGQALFEDMRSGTLLGDFDVPGAGIYNVPLRAAALPLLNNAGGPLALGMALGPLSDDTLLEIDLNRLPRLLLSGPPVPVPATSVLVLLALTLLGVRRKLPIL
ncbi:MAG: hypothetical protein HKN19_17360 [Halioglobus sp.]|nr:hypothetical protein [Halioglobus sp.]